MRNSVHDQIERQIRSKRKGTIFVADDFKAIGSYTAVKMALSRLAKEGLLVRAAQGIYLYPITDPDLGKLSASTEVVATAIAKRDRARILPSGVDAMNRLGFSTQVPMKSVYITDGSPRNVQVGRRAIKFKHASPKHFALKGKYSSLVVLGLEALPTGDVTPEIIMIVANALSHEDPKVLAQDMALAPARVAKIMREALKLITQ